MTLSAQQLTDIRRHCGYGVQGNAASGQAGYRFFQADGQLEYRLANLTAKEEAVVATYLDTLAGLEAAIPAVAATLDTASAAVWKRNPEERAEREALFDGWRRLCGFSVTDRAGGARPAGRRCWRRLTGESLFRRRPRAGASPSGSPGRSFPAFRGCRLAG